MPTSVRNLKRLFRILLLESRRTSVEPLIDPLLPKEQAGFRRRKSTVDQVVLLTQNIEDSFEAKAGAVFIDLCRDSCVCSTCIFHKEGEIDGS